VHHSKIAPAMTATGHFPALPRRNIEAASPQLADMKNVAAASRFQWFQWMDGTFFDGFNMVPFSTASIEYQPVLSPLWLRGSQPLFFPWEPTPHCPGQHPRCPE
jgi:hypothetical protein